MSVRLEYQDVAPGAAEDASVTATGAASLSTPALLPHGSDNGAEYATLEPGYWALDGSRKIYDYEDISFWSNALSSASGVFSTPPVITITTSQRYTSLGISLLMRVDSWISELEAAWYQGATELERQTYTPDGLSYFCAAEVTAWDKIVLTVKKTSKPYRRARIDKILFGILRVFNRDEIGSGSAKVVQQIDPSGRELAFNTLDWTLRSRDAVEYMFQFKQPVAAYDGDTLIGTFYVDEAARRGGKLYDVRCTDAIGVLDTDYFPDAYLSGANAGTLAADICAGFPLDMDAALAAKTVSGVLVGLTRRQALQQLCFAIGAIADTSGSNAVRIFPLPTGAETEIPPSRTRPGGQVQTDPIVTALVLTWHAWSTTPSDAGSVTIGGVTYYDAPGTVRIDNPLATANDKPNVVEISDAMLVSAADAAATAQRVYGILTRRDRHQLRFRLVGEKPGDRTETTTPWDDVLTGNYIRGTLSLGGFVLCDGEVLVD